MRPFTPFALAASIATLFGAGVITAPAAQAEIVFICAERGPAPLIYPPMINGQSCTPPVPGDFSNVHIVFPHLGEQWRCEVAMSRPNDFGTVNVLGRNCHPPH
ncbi:hypothetical protein AB0I81_62795 [Nonomuraea sp. NPDC050404]|uniref:hypothetical protein n=1 Tax=Nonomuraea sp. NPDC050404 TaxID=3155783 RepID=UPI0033F978FC